MLEEKKERPWYKRKKVWATALGCLGVMMHQLGGVSEEQVDHLVKIVMTFLIGQGVADIGKES